MSVSKVGENQGLKVNAAAAVVAPIAAPPVPPPLPAGDPIKLQAQSFLDATANKLDPINWRQFALMNNTYLIRHSSLDRGLYISESTQAYKSYLSNNIPPFFSMPPGIFGDLNEILINIDLIRKQYPESYIGTIASKAGVETAGKNIYKAIENQLKAKGFAYFTFGYSGKLFEFGSSHALGCKVKRDKDYTTIYFLNKGEGAERHIDLDADTTGYLSSYVYFPVQVKNSEWETKFLPFLYRLVRYIADTPRKKEASYRSAELYDLLHLLGDIRPDLLAKNADRFKGKTQHVGDCADKAVRNVLYDYLIMEKGLKVEEVDRVFLNIHFNSLLAAYHSFKKGAGIDHAKRLMIDAVEQYGTALLRAETYLLPKEFYLASEICGLILKEAEAKPFAQIPVEVPSLKLPKSFDSDFLPSAKTVSLKKNIDICANQSLTIALPPFNPQTFKKDISDWVLKLNEKTDHSIHSALLQLPLPKWEEAGDPWDQIPENDLKDVLTQFNVVLDAYYCLFDANHNILLMHSLMIIVDKLARRCNQRTKLAGFATPFLLEKFENYFIFCSVADQKRYLELKSYLKKASEGALIFPIIYHNDFRKPNSIEIFLKEKKENKKTQGSNHIAYLSQFNTKLKTKEELTDFWFSVAIPKEAMILYRYIRTCECFLSRDSLGTHCAEKMNVRRFNRYFNDDHFNDYLLKYTETKSNDLLLIKETIFDGFREEALAVASLIRYKDLKVGKALEWMQSHWHQLGEQSYQNVLESCFFSINALSDAIDEHPGIILEFRQAVENGLLFFQNKKDKLFALMFLIRLSFSFETFLAEKTSKAIDQSVINKQIERLKKLLTFFDLKKGGKEEDFHLIVCSHLILFQSLQITNEKDFITFFTDVFKYRLATDGISIGHSSRFFATRLIFYQLEVLKKFERFLEAQGAQKEVVLNRVLHQVIENVLPKSCYNPANPPPFTLKGGSAHSEDFIIDLHAGRIYHPNEKLQYTLTRLTAEEIQRHQMKEKQIDHLTYWWKANNDQMPNLFVSIDRTLWFFYGNDFSYGGRFVPNPEKKDFLTMVLFTKEELQKLPFLRAFTFSHKLISHDLAAKKAVIVSTIEGEKTPYCHIEFNNKKVTVTRNNGALKLVNLKDLPLSSHPLLKIAPPDEILCFVNSQTDEIEELEFIRLKLSFKKNAAGKLECLQEKGFYYKSDTLNALGSLSSEAIILTDGTEKIKVILPFPIFEKREMGYDTAATEKLKKKGERAPYFTYELNANEDQLKCPTFSHKLFLIYFYKVHGNFEKAQNELNQILKPITFDPHSFEVCHFFLKLKDQTPRALNFNLKILLLICDSYSQIPYQLLGEAYDFLHQAQYCHLLYWRLMGHETWGNVGKKERLTEIEEARILATYTREKIPQYKILELREAMIHDTERSGKIQFLPQDVDLSPAPFTRLTPPEELEVSPIIEKTLLPIDYPNRLSLSYLEQYFPLLYAEALKAKPYQLEEFDYTLLAAFQGGKENTKLASLLFYVRHFQSVFNDLAYTEANLYEIQRRARCLREHPLYEFIIQDVVKKTVRVEVFKSNTVLIVKNEEIEALHNVTKQKVLNLKKEITEEELEDKMGATVTPEEMQELSAFKAKLASNDPRKKTLDKLEKSLQVFDIKPVRLPQESWSLVLLLHDKKVLLVTEAEYQTIKHSHIGKAARFTEKVTLDGLKKASSHQKILSLPPLSPSTPLPKPEAMNVLNKPLESIKTTLFKETPLSSFANEPLFDQPQNPMEAELFEKYKAKHTELLAKKRSLYTVENQSIAPTLALLAKEKKDLSDLLKKSLDKIDLYLNDPYKEWTFKGDPQQAKHFQLRLNSKQTERLTAEQVMKEVVIKGHSQLFARERSMYEAHHIKIILAEVSRYFHLQVLEKMVTEAEELLKRPLDVVAKTKLFEILNYSFSYDPAISPEISYFIVKTGLRPRPEQLAIFFWVVEGFAKEENRLFQLPPGGGKTTVLTPLIILHLKRYKAMVSVNTTSAILPVERQNLAANLKLLDEEIGSFDVTLFTELTLFKLKRLHHDIKFFISNRKTIINTPQMYYALRLAKLTLEDKEKLEIIDKCLDLLKRFCIMLGDESHRTADPHTQALFGVGEQKKIPWRHRHLLLELMKPVMGLTKVICDGGKEVGELCRLKENAQTQPDEKEMVLIQKALAKEAEKLMLGKQGAALKEKIVKFWSDKDVQMPELPAGFPEKDKNLLSLAKYFIQKLLPQVVRMKNGYDHVVSIEQGEIDTPAYHQNPSHAQFKDSYLTEVLSIKGSILRGLNDKQWEALLKLLQKQDEEEIDLAADSEKTPSRELYHKWTGQDLRAINLKDEDSIKNAIVFLKKNINATIWYLNNCIIRGISYSKEEITLSPTHFVDGFKMACLFTGTPLAPLAYPRSVQQKTKLDEISEVEVLAEANEPRNRNFVYPESIISFFSHMAQNKASYKNVRALIGAGEFLCDEKNSSIALKWLNSSDLKAVLYFTDGEGKFAFVMKTANGPVTINLESTELSKIKVELLKKHKIDFDTIEVGTYYDASHAESANIAQTPDTKAVIFVGDNLTLSHAIQSIMRLRGFTTPQMKQSIIWAIAPALAKKISADKPMTPRLLFTFYLQNEVKARKSGILLCAFQEICHCIEKAASSFEKLKKGVKEMVDPKKAWQTDVATEETEKALMAYAEGVYKRFGFEIAFKDNQILKVELSKIIAEAKQKIVTLEVNYSKTAALQMNQKAFINKVVKKVIVPKDLSQYAPEPLKVGKKITDGDYQTSLVPTQRASHIFKAPFSEKLYLDDSYLYTATQGGVSLKERFMKKIDYLVVTVANNKFFVKAVSNDIAAQVVEDFKRVKVDLQVPHKAFITRASGKFYRKGKGPLEPSSAEIEAITGSAEMQDVVNGVAVLNGKMPLNDRFKSGLQSFPQFNKLWAQINEAHAENRDYTRGTFRAFIEASKNPLESLTLNNNIEVL